MAEIMVGVNESDLMEDVSTEQVKYYRLPNSIEGFDVACEILSLDGNSTGFIGKFDAQGVFVYGLACGEDDSDHDSGAYEADFEEDAHVVLTTGERKGECGVVLNEVTREGNVVSYVVELSDDVIVTIDVTEAVKLK